jgi:hypothetical protein
MSVMNIIYACDDICDFCEYLRLLEKKKTKKKKKRKPLRREQTPMLSAKGAPQICGMQSFAESRNLSSRRRPLLQREPDTWLSAKTPSSTRARYLALGEDPVFNESQISGSRRRSGPHS